MSTLRKCAECGAVFETYSSRYCPTCLEALDKEFWTVYNFIRENPKTAYLSRVSEETGVSRKTIWYFIRQGRIELSAFADGEELAKQISQLGGRATKQTPPPKESPSGQATRGRFFTHRNKR